jgi:hypothetical protein
MVFDTIIDTWSIFQPNTKKEPLDPFTFKSYIFFIFGWMIEKVVSASFKALQNHFEMQKQESNAQKH